VLRYDVLISDNKKYYAILRIVMGPEISGAGESCRRKAVTASEFLAHYGAREIKVREA